MLRNIQATGRGPEYEKRYKYMKCLWFNGHTTHTNYNIKIHGKCIKKTDELLRFIRDSMTIYGENNKILIGCILRDFKDVPNITTKRLAFLCRTYNITLASTQ